MYAQIVVLSYQPPDIKTYTYKIPENLDVKIGQLVSVPFGKRTPMGVVVDLGAKTAVAGEIKDIAQILQNNPLLLPYQIKLLNWMHTYWRAPMVNCLEAMLPKIPPTGLIPAVNPMPSAGINPVSGQTLVLLPSINQIPETIAKFKAKNFVVYHGEQKPQERFSNWQKIKSGNVDFVFGTRSAIFVPCPNLKQILIHQEHEEGFRDERSPYYKTLTVAEKVQELTGAKLEIFDSAPKVTTYFSHKINLPTRINLVKVKIVNMLEEKATGNRSPISGVLEDYIRRGHAKGKKILLFLNKKKESGHLYCRNCKYSDFAQKQPDVCPNCKSADMAFSSLNVNSLSTLVKKIAPDVEIATAAVFYKLLPKKYDLVAHILTDSALFIPDFTSTEKLFTQINNLKKITRGLLLLQTYNPQDPTINAAAEDNFQKFFADQISQRKALGYPPFALLVKLSTKGKNDEKLERKAEQTRLILADTLARINLVTVLGPYKPAFAGKTAKYNIILKIAVSDYSLKSKEAAQELVAPALAKVPRDFQVEVEPENL